MLNLQRYSLVLIYFAVNVLCLWKFINHELIDVEFILFFIFSTAMTYMLLSLLEERQDV